MSRTESNGFTKPDSKFQSTSANSYSPRNPTLNILTSDPNSSLQQSPIAAGTSQERKFMHLPLLRRVHELILTNAGLLLIGASQCFFSLMNVSVKQLNSLDVPVPTLELIFVRMGITLIFSLIYMKIREIPDPLFGPPGVRLLLAFRGFSGFFGLFGVYYSLQYLSLSDATVLTFLAPLCTALLGYLLLGESFTRREAIAGAFSLLGVILIARPQVLFGGNHDLSVGDGHGIEGVPELSDSTEEDGVPSAKRLLAVGVALCGVLGASGAYTTIRAIGTRAHVLHSLTAFSSLCVVTSSISMLVLRMPFILPTRPLWIVLLIMIGVFGFIAQTLLTMGLQREKAGRGTMAVYIQIVFATIFERMFFNTTPSFLSILGTIIIITSAIYTVVIKSPSESTNTSSSRHPRAGATGGQEDLELEAGLLQHDDLERQNVHIDNDSTNDVSSPVDFAPNGDFSDDDELMQDDFQRKKYRRWSLR